MNDFSHIDDEFVDKCIRSEQLQLTKDERRSHFLPVTYLVIIVIVSAAFGIYGILEKTFSGELDLSDFSMIALPLFFALASYFVYRRQINALQFFSIESDLPLSEKRRIVDLVGEEMDWKKVYKGKNIVIGKTSNFSLWGERITVIFYENYVMVNSICDPHKKTSIIGPNTDNINAFYYKFEDGK